MDNSNLWKKSLESHINVFSRISKDEHLSKQVKKTAEAITASLRNKGLTVFFGNGGSAADAQHIAAEFAGKFKLIREPLNVLALNTNISVITAISNDMDYKYIFTRQLSAIIKPGDVAVGITTSGTSENVLLALKEAKEKGALTVAMTGENYNETIADIVISVPSDCTPNIQEAHIMIGHYLADYAESSLFGAE